MKYLMGLFFSLLCLNAYAQKRALGVMLGNPTGLNGKYWISDSHAIDGAFGMSFGKNNEWSLHSDYLKHNQGVLIFNETHPLDLYYGLGGRMEFADTIELGLRIPVGLAHEVRGGGSDIFAEFAPILDFLGRSGLEVHLVVGARYYF